ncbi:MAG: PLP-dependent aminotransferase family protein [Thermomicrobium sp.]|nr:PLP-dependent aminotransferase family protein [Thermomicrobium sp.]
MQIRLDRTSRVPLYRQLADQLRRRIASGELPPGTRLPPERRLAAMLGVNRSTVVSAYRELAAEGLIAGHVGRGTVVVDPNRRPGAEAPARGVPWPQLFAPLASALYDPALEDASAAASRADVISLATGQPAPECYPISMIRQLLDEALHSQGARLLQYCPAEGYPPLREAIARWAQRSGIRCSPEQVLVVSGSQQGLYLIARALLEPGDLVAVEAPTYVGALQVFRALGARLLPIPIDEFGMRVSVLEQALEHRRPKLVYTLPTFQNPSGTTLVLERRRRLLELAARTGIPIVEDDPYRELWYEAPPPPPLAALDTDGTVVSLTTVSKVLFPGFRIGWVIAPWAVVRQLTLVKQLVDLDTNPLMQWAIWAILERGLLESHLEELRVTYRERRDLLANALRRELGDALRFALPTGGLYLWCELTGGLRARDLLPEAARRGVVFAPGESFFVDPAAGRSWMRLNFTYPNPTALVEAARRLSHALAAVREAREFVRRATTPIV